MASIMYAQPSPMLGPFWSNDDYLLVAEFHHQNVYQLKPESGEVRAITISSCQPVSLTFDPSINGLYMTCVKYMPNRQSQYRILKKTFDGKINEVIYNAPQSKEHCLYTASKYYHLSNNIIVWRGTWYSRTFTAAIKLTICLFWDIV